MSDQALLGQLIRMHELQRRIYLRFLGWLVLAIAGFASCLVRAADLSDDLGDVLGPTGMLTAVAVVMCLVDARELRAVHRRMWVLMSELRTTGVLGVRSP